MRWKTFNIILQQIYSGNGVPNFISIAQVYKTKVSQGRRVSRLRQRQGRGGKKPASRHA